MPMSDQDLLNAALAARENAHAPYSKFKVGAALRTPDGTVFTGANVENRSYGLTICAERSAVAAAVSQGRRSFERLCVVADTPNPVRPCGACLQVLDEFAPHLTLILANTEGATKTLSLRELFPHPFED